jgi:hypothetical protein
MANKAFDSELFKDHTDYWQVAKNIKDIYMSEGTLLTLLDFERVLDSLDIYAFKNWELGELVQGPTITKYRVSCVFLWPENLMPDPRGGRRLLPFDCEVKYKRTNMKIPLKIEDPKDYRPGTKIARIIEKKVWLVEITIPKALMSDIRTGSVELEEQELDLDELDNAYYSDKEEAEQQSGGGQEMDMTSPEQQNGIENAQAQPPQPQF